ncbi:hypothetical protein AAF712_015236 [Marasmius tenuissimus]|uniref:Uncharacterized protein n=1 Tax=Marasmius tenuissimus TaxID=585030 RepID=A0ABR2ZA53_9AGAR
MAARKTNVSAKRKPPKKPVEPAPSTDEDNDADVEDKVELAPSEDSEEEHQDEDSEEREIDVHSQDKNISTRKSHVQPLDRDAIKEDDFIIPSDISTPSRASSVSLAAGTDFLASDWDNMGLNIPGTTKAPKQAALETVDSNDSNGSPAPPAKKTCADNFLAEHPAIVVLTSPIAPWSSTAARKSKKMTKQIPWAPETEYIHPDTYKHVILKSAQNEMFSTLLEKASIKGIALFLWECAFPEKGLQQARLLLDAMVMAAEDLGKPEISARLQHQFQKKYQKGLADYVFN